MTCNRSTETAVITKVCSSLSLLLSQDIITVSMQPALTVQTQYDELIFTITTMAHWTYRNTGTWTTLGVIVLPLTADTWCSRSTGDTTNTPARERNAHLDACKLEQILND